MKKRLFYKEIVASVEIEASPDRVWDVLTDFKSWERWNQFIPLVEGSLTIGAQLRIKVVSPGLKPMIFKPTVFEVKPMQRIVWGGGFLGVVYRGDHAFIVEPITPSKTRFTQVERFMGPMVIFMGEMIKKTEQGYLQMNAALKKEVESRM